MYDLSLLGRDKSLCYLVNIAVASTSLACGLRAFWTYFKSSAFDSWAIPGIQHLHQQQIKIKEKVEFWEEVKK